MVDLPQNSSRLQQVYWRYLECQCHILARKDIDFVDRFKGAFTPASLSSPYRCTPRKPFLYENDDIRSTSTPAPRFFSPSDPPSSFQTTPCNPNTLPTALSFSCVDVRMAVVSCAEAPCTPRFSESSSFPSLSRVVNPECTTLLVQSACAAYEKCTAFRRAVLAGMQRSAGNGKGTAPR